MQLVTTQFVLLHNLLVEKFNFKNKNDPSVSCNNLFIESLWSENGLKMASVCFRGVMFINYQDKLVSEKLPFWL